MPKSFGGILGRATLYLLYAGGMLGLSLWLLFPGEQIQRSLEELLGRVYPAVRWQVGPVSLAFPLGVRVAGIEGFGRGGEKQPLVRMDPVMLRPLLLASLRTWTPRCEYHILVGRGSVVGTLELSRDGRLLQLEGATREVRLGEVQLVSRQLGRTVEGVVSGTFAAVLDLGSGDLKEVDARFTLASGRLGLKRPVFGHSELPFSQAKAVLRGQGEIVRMEQGEMVSELFDAQFAGTLTPHRAPLQTGLDLKGGLRPKPKLFSRAPKTVALQALQFQLKDEALPFRISGDLANPGVHYEGFSMLVHALEKEWK